MKGFIVAPVVFLSLLVSLSQMRPAGISHGRESASEIRYALRAEKNPLLKQAQFSIKESLLDRLQKRKV